MWILAALVAIAVLMLVAVVWKMRRRKLSAGQSREILHKWEQLMTLSDDHRRILEADKLLDETLRLLGYQGSLGEKLQKTGPRFPDLHALWAAHKLRNRVAHDIHVQLNPAETDRALKTFERAIRSLIS